MRFNDFQPLALVTESKIEKVMMNRVALLALLGLSIATTEIVDLVKKNVFYGRPIDPQKLESLQNEVTAMNAVLKEQDLVNGGKEVIEVNPRIFHALVGKFTETGEMLEAMEDHIATGEPLDVVNLGEELGDDQWYNAILCDETGLKMPTVLVTVINKLKARYGDKFDAYLAKNRDILLERSILEDGLQQDIGKVGEVLV